MSEKPENVHKGHRQRLRRRYLQEGLDRFEDVNALELLLFYGIPRQDTNVIAHRLLDRFHSLHGVLEAPVEDLMALGGLSENAAVLLKLVMDVARKSQVSREEKRVHLSTIPECGDFLVPYFLGETEEKVMALALDGKCEVLACTELFRGNVNATNFSVRGVVEFALRTRATSIVLAHNHPSGVAVPSQEDIRTTQSVQKALDMVNVLLADHIVVGGGDYVSMVQSGFIRQSGW